MIKIKVKRSEAAKAFAMPSYQTKGAAAFDLVSTQEITLTKGKISLVGTGLFMEIPEGYEGQIRPRSGLATQGITVTNAPGTIDSDYRGEIKIIMENSGVDYHIVPGMRIAQMVIAPVMQVEFEEVDDLSDSARGGGGFGSTGK